MLNQVQFKIIIGVDLVLTAGRVER